MCSSSNISPRIATLRSLSRRPGRRFRCEANKIRDASAGWVQRWSGPLAVAAMHAHAAPSLSYRMQATCAVQEMRPDLHEILAEVRELFAVRQPAAVNLTRPE